MGCKLTLKRLEIKAMKQLILVSYLLLLVIPGLAYGVHPDSEPAVILYHDGFRNINLSDISTQPKPNRIIDHMFNIVLPKVYGINIKLKPCFLRLPEMRVEMKK